VILLSYDVSFDGMTPDSSDEGLFASIGHEKTQELFDLVHDDPAKAVEPLRSLLDAHPGSQTLVQWLGAALNATGEIAGYQRLAELNYQNHPTYLFARLDYYRSLLQHGQLERVEELLDKNFDLKFMYPERNVFHISEVLAFNAFMIEFWIRKGELDHAKPHLEIMTKLMPDASLTQGCTDLLERAMFMHRLKQRAKKLLGAGILPI
jgi:hypothetical protein